MKKGLDIALSLAARLAETGRCRDRKQLQTDHENHIAVKQLGAEYVGDVRGKRKAELLAGAKAFLFPTRVAKPSGWEWSRR